MLLCLDLFVGLGFFSAVQVLVPVEVMSLTFMPPLPEENLSFCLKASSAESCSELVQLQSHL